MKLILGIGLTGLSVARFFSSNNIAYRIADSRLSPPMQDICIKENLLSDCHLGEWKESLLKNITEVVISPGIAETESRQGLRRCLPFQFKMSILMWAVIFLNTLIQFH